MALEKRYEAKDGGDYAKSYWKVAQVNISTIDKVGHIDVYCYRDKAASDAGKEPIEIRKYDLRHGKLDVYYVQAGLDTTGKVVVERAYNYLKQEEDEFFKRARDV